MASKKRKDPTAVEELNMTPMIDVVFLLLIFFMIITDMSQKELDQLVLPWSEQAIPDKADEDERRVIINISKTNPEDWPADSSVTIRIRKKAYDLETLTQEMFKHAETKRDLDHPNKPSEIYALIRYDQDIRWREVQWVMQACADPAVRIYKLQFATSVPAED